MAEAANSVHLTKLRTTIAFATRVRALQVATNAVKRRLQAEGLKLSEVTHRELRARAEQYLALHREELIASAALDVEQWRQRGVFGRPEGLNHLRFPCADIVHEMEA
jgi:hypothetical protein